MLSSIVLRKHRISIADQFSYTEKINLQWLQYLIYWIGVIWVCVLFRNDDLIFDATVLFILFIGFFGIRQAGIFHSPSLASPNNTDDISAATGIETETIDERSHEPELTRVGKEKRKYQKSGLGADDSDRLHRLLTQTMSNEKLCRQSELSLRDLAERLNVPTNYLSQVINEREGKNFYDYINTMRVEEFMRLAASPENRRFTLLALAQQCGFNSKSSFNRYFRKVRGQSPSEFMSDKSESGK